MDHYQALATKIDNLLSGKLSVSEFEKEYYTYYLETVPDGALTIPQSTFYGLVQEKLDWTTEKPNDQEREDGWLDYSDYVEWLRNIRFNFQKDEDGWYKNYVQNNFK